MKNGFTLIELLLYMGLVALFMTATVHFAWDVVLGNVKAGVHQEVQENLRFANHKIQTEIRNADQIVISESDFGVNLVTDPEDPEERMVTFSGTGTNYPVKFRVDSGVLQIKRGGGDWVALTSSLVKVTDLTFTDLSERQVLGCGFRHGNAMRCCFMDGRWMCEWVANHLDKIVEGRDCRGPAGTGTVEHKRSCEGDLFYENVKFILEIEHRNPSGRSEWAKKATFETSVQIRSNQ